MEISKMLTISTAHITEETNKILENPHNTLPLVTYNKDGYGWFVYIPEKDFAHDVKIIKKLPDDLAILFMFARCHEINIICLDSDGDEINNLPVYNWF